jgi:DNA-binding SARP family transcriptional activator
MEKKFLSRLKTLANTNIQWEAFNEMLDYYIGLHQTKLEQATDTIEIYKAQGAIQAFRKLKYLREEINAESKHKTK